MIRANPASAAAVRPLAPASGGRAAPSAGELVQAILELTGWTQARLVRELRRTAEGLREPVPTGLTLVTVNRWKQGRQSASAYYQRLLRHLYARVYRTWALPSRARMEGARGRVAPRLDEADETERRELLAYTALLKGAATLHAARLADRAQSGPGVDAALLDSLAGVMRGYARQWHVLPPTVLLGVVRSQLFALNELRTAARTAAASRRLADLTGRAAGLATWLSWLSGSRDAALAYAICGEDLAGAAGNDELRAFVLVVRSFLCSPLFGAAPTAARDGLAQLDEACRLADRGSSPYLRVFALTRRAEERAAAGGRGASLAADRDLDGAERALEDVREPNDGFFGYWDAGRLAGCRGTVAVLLSRPAEAIDLLSGALKAANPALASERSVLQIDLGAAHVLRSEADLACEAIRRGMAAGSAGDVNRIERVRRVRRSFPARWSDAAEVKLLDEELRGAA